MRVCCHNNCDVIFDDHGEGRTARCPVCGYAVSCWVPDRADIICGCLRVQATWTEYQEISHRQVKNQEAEILTISQHPRGRRVMRGHDHDR